jgi:hypothetical protein
VVGDAIQADADDLFEVLVRIREQLEPQGWFVAVQGSRLDTFPSGMQRDMGVGLSVYVLRMGEPARLGDVVETFAEADPSLLATVDAQHRHTADWQSSIQGGVGRGRQLATSDNDAPLIVHRAFRQLIEAFVVEDDVPER